jgi:transposase
MITEIGDIQRFPHPRQLVSWVGMDIREYSSGGKHNRFGITKHGNRHLRTASRSFTSSNWMELDVQTAICVPSLYWMELEE